MSTDNGDGRWLRSNYGTIVAVSREDSSEGANTEYGVVVEEGLLFVERWQRPATNVRHILLARLSRM